MSPTSSGPVLIAGALRHYGLVEYDGSGDGKKLRLTHDALRILLDKTPTSQVRLEALQRAFLAPKIFSEMWAKWKADLPSDQTIINYLVLERRLNNQAPFSEQAALELLANYRASLAFAPAQDGVSVPPTDGESSEATEMDTSATQAVTQPQPQMQPSLPLQTQAPSPKVRLVEHERVVFVEEGAPNQYFKLIASG